MTNHRTVLTRAAWIAVLAGEVTCDTCDGRGSIPRVGRHGGRACPACHGRGVPLTPAYAQPAERRVTAHDSRVSR